MPFTDILNCSFKEGIVPHQRKKAIVVPIPKQTPARIDKLLPVSLTSIFAKIVEGFLFSWVLNDISDIIDKKRKKNNLLNVPGVSTSHYFLNLLHFLHVGAEKSHNVGTVVLIDFSKAFDLENHTVLIDKIIEIGANRNIIPRVCDFLDHRQQCVRYNCDLSDYSSLVLVPYKAQNLVPLASKLLSTMLPIMPSPNTGSTLTI